MLLFRSVARISSLAAFSLFGLSFGLSIPASIAQAGDSVWDLVSAMNQARRDNGVHELRVDDRLLNSSGTHARDMAQRSYFSHDTPEGWGAGLRIHGWGYSHFAGVGENIAGGQRDAWEVVRAWLASPGHRVNLLNPRYNAVGAGHYYQPGSSYVQYWVGHYGTD